MQDRDAKTGLARSVEARSHFIYLCMLHMPPLVLLCALLCPDWPKLPHMASLERINPCHVIRESCMRMRAMSVELWCSVEVQRCSGNRLGAGWPGLAR